MYSESSTKSQVFSVLLHGLTKALPIVIGYIPIGFAYGVLARQAGLSTLNTLLMSVIVYAGSSQLIAVSLFASAVPGLTIILTTFVVNLRHMLFSAALSPYLKGWKRPELAIFSYELTDESFAVYSASFSEKVPPKLELITINMTAQVAWILGSVLGVFTGQLISDVKPIALDYTLPAMFIALLVMQMNGKKEIIVAAVSGVFCIGLILLGVSHWSVIIATVTGATIGLLIEEVQKYIMQRGYV
jgi:4-azaleucine resistance transporter AzlC